MGNFIQTLKNIWSIEELRNRILFTLFILAVYRFGAHIVLPGISPEVLASAVNQRSDTDILGLINMFSGGAFNKASIFALGIMPYITASIIIQLLGFVVPYFQKLQQQEGESGRKRINQYTRFLTLLITIVQGTAYIGYIVSLNAVDPSVPMSLFWTSSIIILATGTLFAMWLGEKITDRGIGNGISLLIMVGIIATLPVAFSAEVQALAQAQAWFTLILEIAGLFLVTMATLMAVQGVRRIPIQFAKRMIGRSSANIPAAGARDFIPLKVNAAGVMPIIFAQAIMFLPITISNKLGGGNNAFLTSLADWKSVPYNIIFFLLVVLFTYVYTALLVNPQQYAEYLKRQNAFIPGIKPGKNTEDYIDTLTTRVTLPGSIFLGLISILPAVVGRMGVNDAFAIFFGGTSLLIMVGVALDTLQQIESYLLRRKYDGLVKSGKLKGRNSGSGMQSIGAGI